MHKSKIENLNPQEYTHLPHAEQKFEDHEQTDVAIRPLVWTLIGIASLIVVSGVGMWGLFRFYEYLNDNASDNQPLSEVSTMSDPRQVPEGMPELQGVPTSVNPRSPAQDMALMRERNDKVLAGNAPMRDGMQPGMSIEAAMAKALDERIFKTAASGGAPATQPATQPAQAPPPAGQSADASRAR